MIWFAFLQISLRRASRCRIRPDIEVEAGGIGRVGIGMQLALVSKADATSSRLGNSPLRTKVGLEGGGVGKWGGRPPSHLPEKVLLLVQAAVVPVAMERSPAAKIAPRRRWVR